MKFKIYIVLFLCLFIMSCAVPANYGIKISPEEEVYLAKVMESPLEFAVPKDQAEDTWARIQSFIGKYSSMKIQIATDYVIETYNARGERYGYKATKTPTEKEIEFSITCICGSMFLGDSAIQNAHILAYYANTGELIERLIRR